MKIAPPWDIAWLKDNNPHASLNLQFFGKNLYRVSDGGTAGRNIPRHGCCQPNPDVVPKSDPVRENRARSNKTTHAKAGLSADYDPGRQITTGLDLAFMGYHN
jgi:hypothetical protein